MKYKCLFFDLDHTLWDYETNCRETLTELYDDFELRGRGVPDADQLYLRFRDVNLALWDSYDRGEITSDFIRSERFKQVLEPFGAYEHNFSERLSRAYLSACPHKGNLMPNALETIQYLAERHTLTIITNGFEEIQHLKVAAGKLTPYFAHIITSQKAGHKKPAREIFHFAMKLNNVNANEALMVGDNLLTDIAGARNANIDHVYFNPDAVAHNEVLPVEIRDLRELRALV